MCFYGDGVTQSYIDAFGWYRKAGDQGYSDALATLGYMYQKGRGVPRDDTEATRYFLSAAEKGLASAQTTLGYMYRTGKGPAQDYAGAARWYQKAADTGYAPASLALSRMYRAGQGVPQSSIKAARLAAEAYGRTVVRCSMRILDVPLCMSLVACLLVVLLPSRHFSRIPWLLFALWSVASAGFLSHVISAPHSYFGHLAHGSTTKTIVVLLVCAVAILSAATAIYTAARATAEPQPAAA